MIISFYDNEKYDYPFVEIKTEYFDEFERILNKYQEDEEYNFDDFISLIKKEKWFISLIKADREVFF